MNPKHYCTLPIAQRLHEAGIKIETEKHWIVCKDGVSFIAPLGDIGKHAWSDIKGWFPALSMSEAWEALPEELKRNGTTFELNMIKQRGLTGLVYYSTKLRSSYQINPQLNPNPTDACCEMLIWLKSQGKGERHD